MLCIFISVFIYSNSAKIIFKGSISSFRPHLKIIGNCYYANVLKEEKKKLKYTIHRTFMKTHIVQQTKHQLRHDISRHVKLSNIINVKTIR